MKLLADENLDAPIVRWLRELGHDVVWMCEQSPGTGDDRIMNLGRESGRVIVTNDLDFGELVFHQGSFCAGVVLLRIASPRERLGALKVAWPRIEQQALGHFVVLTTKKLRIRPLT